MTYHGITLPRERLEEFCRKHGIRKLALFGSVVRDDFGPESDVDVLVEFDPERRVGLFELAAAEYEMAELLGRKVDLITEGFLEERIRQRVLREAKVEYDLSRG